MRFQDSSVLLSPGETPGPKESESKLELLLALISGVDATMGAVGILLLFVCWQGGGGGLSLL